MTLALLVNRGFHRRPGGWTPKQLGTLSLWLDADDATTITLSTGVSQWDDKSGNARHVTQATGSAQPTWTKGVQNGRAVLGFDGTKWLAPSPIDVLDIRTGGMSIVGAFAGNSIVMSKTSASVNATGEWQFTNSGASVYLGSTTVTTQQATATSTAKVLSWVLDRTNGSTVWNNGSQADADTGAPFPDTSDVNGAADLLVGARGNSTTAWFSGSLYELVVSLSTLSTSDREKCEGYLAHKWGLTGNLPSDHPWKAVAP